MPRQQSRDLISPENSEQEVPVRKVGYVDDDSAIKRYKDMAQHDTDEQQIELLQDRGQTTCWIDETTAQTSVQASETVERDRSVENGLLSQ